MASSKSSPGVDFERDAARTPEGAVMRAVEIEPARSYGRQTFQ
jgi:hypothetical protein